ncbi:alanine dehydrogenase [Actinomyces sp. 2119]|uniref:alanine dehydrogenase n=1 Tax=Actinomyces sp. 2119 TaxID=2321393 RepID=UPI000E6B9F39|nr:alanine dehydrogenase [Actinomyces sp. 2119]RJF41554.1 alanine dehydrogenase [Actinomyces sp. 2119]
MRVGIPTEVKDNEFRVAITPAGVHALVQRGHEVRVQTGAGLGSAIADQDYAAAGAVLVEGAARVWAESDLVLKVKEPVACEYEHMRPGQVLFTYLHLAADRRLTEELLSREITSVAYETVETDDGSLPLLAPMSEIAGRLAAQVGADQLLRPSGGSGVLLGGASGVRRGRVAVLGGGTAGLCAAQVSHGMGADVTVFDISPTRMRYIEEVSGRQIRTRFSTELDVAQACAESDLVIGAALVPGGRAPHLVTREMVAAMRPGSVLVDVAIDQGGCFEDSRPTTHAAPTFEVEQVTFYCVTNMPGAVPHTSTYALTNATLPYVTVLADRGWREACTARPDLARGLTTYGGVLYTRGVGEALGMATGSVADLLEGTEVS